MGMEDKYLAQASSEKCKSVWFDNYVAGRKIWSISISKKKY
jgi:hypothetical protein